MAIVAQRIRNARGSETKAVTALAAALAAGGREILVLSQGEPDFDTPEHVREAGIRAIEGGKTRYTSVAGVAELRQAIADKLKRDAGLDYPLDAITVGCGAKQVIFNALLSSIDPGDEVVIPAPCWVSYPEMVKLAGGTPIVIPTQASSGWKMRPAQLEATITPKTKWLLLNSPQNPTGAVYSDTELAALAQVIAPREQILVLCDDIYEKILYPPARYSCLPAVAPELHDRCLVVNGVSKSHCMTGWRVGYGAGPLELIEAMNRVQGQSSSHTCSISQHAARAAIAGDDGCVTRARNAFQGRRDLIVDLINRIPGLHCKSPDGAFYLFVNCEAFIGRRTKGGDVIVDDAAFAAYLMEEADVAVVPGASFMGAGHFRLSFATSEVILKRACEQIARACAALE